MTGNRTLIRSVIPWYALGGLALALFTAKLAVPLWTGRVGAGDPPELTSPLTEQALTVTRDLNILATGTLGLLGFLFSDKISSFWQRSSTGQRHLIVGGALLCVCALLTGLLTSWAIASVTADGLVRVQLKRLIVLQALEAAEIAAGFLLISVVALISVDQHK